MSRLLLVLALVGCAHPQTPNQVFRADYKEAKQRALAAAGPILLVEGDRLVLVDGPRRDDAELLPREYHDLKVIAHMPLAVFVCLQGGAVDRAQLQNLRAAIAALPHHEVTDASAAYLDRVLASGRADGLDEFARAMGPKVLALAAQAARLELDRLHALVQAWRPRLGDHYHVVVIGSHMARQGEIATTYFERLLGQPEGDRIVYAESLWEEPRALDLLATHLVDRAAAQAFFGDPARLHRDLLGDAAREYVDKLLR